ncbi:MAG: sirohydrochlorin cobaltochelatase, partial [Clostridiales bacterium]|nr:sirohydrochlorin cobaltochelatase [Clostridiales bacterium]
GPTRAILVLSVGAGQPEPCARSIGGIEAAVSAAFPDWEVRRAFTSGAIRARLERRSGIRTDSTQSALQKLADTGYDSVICLPTHVTSGGEYESVLQCAGAFSSSFSVLKCGTPLLSSVEDYRALAQILSRLFPHRPDTVVCLAGHGSLHHPANAAYAALDYHLKDIGRADLFVGTAEGFPDFDTVLRHMKESGQSRCVLAPLMVTAGAHIARILSSNGTGSWKTGLERAGFQVDCILKGLGEYPEIQERYVTHARAPIKTITP